MEEFRFPQGQGPSRLHPPRLFRARNEDLPQIPERLRRWDRPVQSLRRKDAQRFQPRGSRESALLVDVFGRHRNRRHGTVGPRTRVRPRSLFQEQKNSGHCGIHPAFPVFGSVLQLATIARRPPPIHKPHGTGRNPRPRKMRKGRGRSLAELPRGLLLEVWQKNGGSFVGCPPGHTAPRHRLAGLPLDRSHRWTRPRIDQSLLAQSPDDSKATPTRIVSRKLEEKGFEVRRRSCCHDSCRRSPRLDEGIASDDGPLRWTSDRCQRLVGLVHMVRACNATKCPNRHRFFVVLCCCSILLSETISNFFAFSCNFSPTFFLPESNHS